MIDLKNLVISDLGDCCYLSQSLVSFLSSLYQINESVILKHRIDTIRCPHFDFTYDEIKAKYANDSNEYISAYMDLYVVKLNRIQESFNEAISNDIELSVETGVNVYELNDAIIESKSIYEFEDFDDIKNNVELLNDKVFTKIFNDVYDLIKTLFDIIQTAYSITISHVVHGYSINGNIN